MTHALPIFAAISILAAPCTALAHAAHAAHAAAPARGVVGDGEGYLGGAAP